MNILGDKKSLWKFVHHQKTGLFWGTFLCICGQSTELEYFFLFFFFFFFGGGVLKFRTFLSSLRFLIVLGVNSRPCP